MTLSKNRLGTAIKDAVNALSAADKRDIEIVWQAIANEIIDELKDNGLVTVATGIPTDGSETTGTGTGAIT